MFDHIKNSEELVRQLRLLRDLILPVARQMPPGEDRRRTNLAAAIIDRLATGVRAGKVKLVADADREVAEALLLLAAASAIPVQIEFERSREV